MRAFTQAELQIFFDPKEFTVPFAEVAEEVIPVLRAARREAVGEAGAEPVSARALVEAGLPEFYVYHLVHLFRFLRDVLRYPAERLRFFEKSDQERAFYNRIQFDAELRFDSLGGYKEVGAIHYRGDYDLTRHGQGAGRDLSVTPTGRPTVLPHVLELTFGVDRNLWGLADVHLVADGERTVWHLPPYLAPSPVGVFPLIPKAQAPYALALAHQLSSAGIPVQYDEAGTIGKRYARMDEAGAPYCVTIDGGTVADGIERDTVTLRERDSRSQERVPSSALATRLLPALQPPRPFRP
jgi:glycyl-tRNA synthetase